jgi:hypothetical protein
MPHLELIFPHSKSADGFNARRVPHLAIALGAWPTTSHSTLRKIAATRGSQLPDSSLPRVKRSVKIYQDKWPKGFYAPRVTRGPAVLVEDVVSEIDGYLAGGATLADVAETLGVKLNTIQKAMREGGIRAPVKKNSLAMPG